MTVPPEGETHAGYIQVIGPKTDSELREEIINKALAKVRHRESAAQGHEPPARMKLWKRSPQSIWSQWYDDYNGTPFEYAHLAPIQEALAKCRVIEAGTATEETAQVVIRKSDWEALVTLIKGDK